MGSSSLLHGKGPRRSARPAAGMRPRRGSCWRSSRGVSTPWTSRGKMIPIQEPSEPAMRRVQWLRSVWENTMRITSKGQITIPSEIRERTGLQPNSEVILEVEGNTVRIRPALPVDEDKEPAQRPLREEPFVGIWGDREDMAESTEWVRQARQREWTR